MPGDNGDVYVSAHTLLSDRFDGRLATGLQVLEEKPLPTGKVQVAIDAEAMAEDLEEMGIVRVYGIHFDTDKSTIADISDSGRDKGP